MPDHSDGPAWRKARANKPAVPLALEAEPHAADPMAKRRRAPTDPVPVVSVEAALGEITTVAAAALHRQAAHVWAARAVACYRVCLAKADLQEGLSYLYLGEHYREAALAHAAFGEAWRPLQEEVEAVMDGDRAGASGAMRQRSLAEPGVTR